MKPILLIPKPEKDIIRKPQTNILYVHKCLNSQQNTSKPNPDIYQNNLHHDQVGFT